SSRRRHTRSTRDWSSDVCSSDLCWRHDPVTDGRTVRRGAGGSSARLALARGWPHRYTLASGRSLQHRPPTACPCTGGAAARLPRSEEHTSELQSRVDLVCRLLLD